MRLASLEYLRAGRLPSSFRTELGPRVTIVLGDNEAGKSTTRRAIEALLFGPSRELVAPQTVGGFEFAAEARFAGAQSFRLHRRGQNLVEPPPQPLAGLLRDELGGRFRDLFGLSLENLRPDASSFLGAEGALGSLLFGAQTGLAPDQLARLIEELDARIKAAAAAGKKSDGLGVRLASYAAAKAERGNVARFQRYDEASSIRLAATYAVKGREQEVEAAERALAALETLLAGLPTFEALAAAKEALARLAQPHPPATPAQAAALARHRERLEEARTALEARRAAEEEATRALELTPPPSPVVSLAEEAERRSAEVVRVDAERDELAVDRSQAQLAGLALARLVESLGGKPGSSAAEAALALLRPQPVREALQAILKQHAQLESEHVARARELEEALRVEGEARRLSEAAPLRPVAALEPAMPWALAAERAEQEARALDATARELDAELARGARELAFDHLPLEARAGLLRPSALAAKELEERRLAAREALRRATEALAEADARHAEAQATCSALRAELGDVPTGDRVAAMRRLRDERWRAISALFTPALRPEAGALLPRLGEEFELLLREVDELADRRASAGEAAGRLQAEELGLRAAETALTAARATREDAERAATEAETAFREAWRALREPPASAALWLGRREAWEAKQAERAKVEGAATLASARSLQERTNALALVGGELPHFSGLATAAALREALHEELRARTATNKRAEQLRGQLDAATTARSRCEANLARTTRQQEEWARGWAERTAELPEGIERSPTAATNWLASQSELDRARRELTTLSDRIATREKVVATLDATLAELLVRARALDGTLALPGELAPRDAFTTLRDQTRQARTRRDAREKAEEALARAAKERALAARQREEREEALAGAWRALAGDEPFTDEALEEALARATEGEKLRLEIARLGSSLAGRWGADVEAFGARLHKQGRVTLEGEREAGLARCEALRQTLEEERRARHEAEAELRALDEGHDAVAVEHRFAEARAQALDKASELLRLSVARHLLEEARRGATHRDSGLVARASTAFQQLTEGAFEGLRIDQTEGNEPTLVAIEATRQEKGPTELSSGTLDQLWLAVRLAAVEQAARQTPFPLLLDDVFVQFDDTRTTAALRLLATLSEQVQIILFTHHDHLVDLARAAIPEALEVVTLPRPDGTARVRTLATERARHPRPVLTPAPEGETPAESKLGGSSAEELILELLAAAGGAQGKAAVLAAAAARGFELEAAWNNAIRALLDRGVVTQEGQKRGAKYGLARAAAPSG